MHCCLMVSCCMARCNFCSAQMKVAQGKQLTLLRPSLFLSNLGLMISRCWVDRPKNAFKYPDSDDAVFPQHEVHVLCQNRARSGVALLQVMKPVDFRAQNLPMAGTVFRGNRRKYSNEEAL